MKIKAVLSTVVVPVDGLYRITTISRNNLPNLSGIPHYIGHPDTKKIVEETFGAVPSENKLFEGLKPGETAVCFPIKQGKSSRREKGFSEAHQKVTLDDLDIRVVERLE
jgi:hypothetical protein